jgi:hypothetical protein
VAVPRRPAFLRTAGRPPTSLLTVPGVLVTPTSPLWDDRWVAGFSFEPEHCDVPFAFDASAADDFPYWWECQAAGGEAPENALELSEGAADGTKSIGAARSTVDVNAVTLWAGYRCRPSGDDDNEDARARAIAKLEALTPTAIERELWSAQIANLAGFDNPALIDSPTLVQGGTPLGFITALAEIEQSIAETMPLSNPAMIHAQPRVVTAWMSKGLVELAAGNTHLVTASGTIVVPEYGATGASPSNISPAQTASYSYSWAYATGPVRVWLGDIRPPTVRESMDRGVNTMYLRAEREYVLIYNPCGVVAARVALCDELCSGGS